MLRPSGTEIDHSTTHRYVQSIPVVHLNVRTIRQDRAGGEWITWTEINSHLEKLEFEHRFAHLDVDLVPIFQDLLSVAQDYHFLTGSHLQVYGDLGELYGAVTHGLKLHRNYAQGSDGKIGNHFVEVKTITPFKKNDTITLNLKRNFSKVLIVKIDSDFEVQSRLVDRKALPKVEGDTLKLNWSDFASNPQPPTPPEIEAMIEREFASK